LLSFHQLSGLRVLITNKSFAVRGGVELYVRDLAEGLLKRGHFPIIYTGDPGEVSDEIRALSVPVVQDLNQVMTAPDIIHGQDHLQTIIALQHFVKIPAVFFCHGWLAWEAMAPQFPRIRRYVAVDRVCRDRMVFEDGIPESQTRILRSFVDLNRFQQREPLPQTPRRALVFNNYATEINSIAAIREACQCAGIELDVIGFGVGSLVKDPEARLRDYEIVFAKGRSALEALAVGAAVVTCDKGRVGPMVSSADLDRLYLLNFGWSALTDPVTPDSIARQIAQYNPQDAAQVTQQIRATAGRDTVIDQIVSLYEEVIAEQHADKSSDLCNETSAIEKYLMIVAAKMKDVPAVERRAALAELALAQQAATNLRTQSERDHAYAERDEAIADRAQAISSRNDGRVELESARARLADLENVLADQERLVSENKRLVAEHQLWLGAAENLEALARSRAAELDHLKRTLGWRLINYYGPIKYRVVLPVYKKLARVLSLNQKSE
jgi:Glycosyltransferase Family 4